MAQLDDRPYSKFSCVRPDPGPARPSRIRISTTGPSRDIRNVHHSGQHVSRHVSDRQSLRRWPERREKPRADPESRVSRWVHEFSNKRCGCPRQPNPTCAGPSSFGALSRGSPGAGKPHAGKWRELTLSRQRGGGGWPYPPDTALPARNSGSERGQEPLPERPAGCFAQRFLTPF